MQKKLNIKVYDFEEIVSTNTYAKESIFNEDALVVASKQSGGRGRLGHSFYSPEGGLYFSLVRQEISEDDLTVLTLKAGCAVCSSLEKLLDYRGDAKASPIRIKWVNDIYISDKKICGILCEKTRDKVIIGVGINFSADGFPDDIKSIAAGLSDEDIISTLSKASCSAGRIDSPGFKEDLLFEILSYLLSDAGKERVMEFYSDHQYIK